MRGETLTGRTRRPLLEALEARLLLDGAGLEQWLPDAGSLTPPSEPGGLGDCV
jgi:hypothetical protein